MTLTSWVPPGVPSLRHNPKPWTPLLAAKKNMPRKTVALRELRKCLEQKRLVCVCNRIRRWNEKHYREDKREKYDETADEKPAVLLAAMHCTSSWLCRNVGWVGRKMAIVSIWSLHVTLRSGVSVIFLRP